MRDVTEHQQIICTLWHPASGSWHNNMRDDGDAVDFGWSHLQAEQGKAAIAVKKRSWISWDTAAQAPDGYWVVLESILFLSMYLPHTRGRRGKPWGVLQDFKWSWEEHAWHQVEVLHTWHHCWNERTGRGEAAPGASRWWRHETVSRKLIEILWNGKQIWEIPDGVAHEARRQACQHVLRWMGIHKSKNKSSRILEDERGRSSRVKITDYIAVGNEWETRGTVARNCIAQNLTDYWLVLTYIKLPEKRKGGSTVGLQA